MVDQYRKIVESERTRIKELLKETTAKAISELKSTSISNSGRLEKVFDSICHLHKEFESEEAHQEIRSAREQFKRELADKLTGKELEEVEADLASTELQAEAVAFIKSAPFFLNQELDSQEIQGRIGVGIELDDALNRLGISSKTLSKEIKNINARLLGKKIKLRLEELLSKDEIDSALATIEEYRSTVGAKLTEELFGDAYRKLQSS